MFSIACDIVDAKLKVASQVGADVTVNCKTQNLKEISNDLWLKNLCAYNPSMQC